METTSLIGAPAKVSRVARIPELDGIRGLAIALVLVWHYLVCQAQTRPGSTAAYGMKLLSLTWAGVDLFFVLSGFLIGGILLDNRSQPNYFKAFYVRRICRIFPLYYLMFCLFALATMSGLGAWGEGFKWLFGDALPIWSYAVYWQNNMMAATGEMNANWIAITWSLAVEEQFYVVLPLLIRFAPTHLLPWILGVLVITAPVVRVALFLTHPHAGLAGYVLLPGRYDALFLGVLGALALRNETLHEWLKQRLNWIRTTILLGGLLLFALLVKNQGSASRGMSFGGYTILAVVSLAVIMLALLSSNRLTSRVFSNRYLVWLGTISYGVYLFHQPISGLLHTMLLRQPPHIADYKSGLVTLLAIITTLIVAVISSRLFEQPIVRYGQRVRYGS